MLKRWNNYSFNEKAHFSFPESPLPGSGWSAQQLEFYLFLLFSLSLEFWPKCKSGSFLWFSRLFNLFSEAASFLLWGCLSNLYVPKSRIYVFLPLFHVPPLDSCWDLPLACPGLARVRVGVKGVLNSSKIVPKLPPKSVLNFFFFLIKGTENLERKPQFPQ